MIKSTTFKKILALCGFSLVLCLLSIQVGHNWGGDFSMYLAQTKSLLQGNLDELYAINEYAMEQSDLPFGPSLYPMGYSILLTPLYYLFGSNLIVLKIFSALFFVGCIPLVFNILRSLAFKKRIAFYATVLFAINYQFVFMSDSLGSDIPAMFFSFLALDLMLKSRDNDHWIYATTIGLVIFVTYITRTAGLVLIPTLLVFHICFLIKTKKWKFFNVALPYLVFVLCYFIYGQFFESIDGKYLDLIDNVSVQSIWQNVLGYGEFLMEFLVSTKFLPRAIVVLGALVFFPLFVLGIIPLINRDNLFLMCFCASMLVLYILYPFTSIRFVIPLSAFVIYVILNGIHELELKFFEDFPLTKWLGFALILGMLFQSILVIVVHTKEGTNDALTPEMQSIYQYINAEISDDKIFVFHKPRVLRYFTDNNGFMLEDFSSPKVNQADHLLVPKNEINYPGFKIQKSWDHFQLMTRTE